MTEKKTNRGGAGRGQGRKPVSHGEPTVATSIRLTEGQREKLALLGGPAWVRGQIDAEPMETVYFNRPGSGEDRITAPLGTAERHVDKKLITRVVAKPSEAVSEFLAVLNELFDIGQVFHSAIEQKDYFGDFEVWADKAKALIAKYEAPPK